jgi:hypothetical protein
VTLKAEMNLAVAGSDIGGIFRYLAELNLFGKLPNRIIIDNKDNNITEDWISVCLDNYEKDVMVYFGNFYNFMSIGHREIVKTGIEIYPIDPQGILKLLSPLDFELCSFMEIFVEWDSGELGEQYISPGFADLHWPHGWACAFKGAGHKRLVSRRWLEYGPWRVLRGAGDTTLVQFHDVSDGVDAATALAQARPAHQRMGISRTGGFLQRRYKYGYDLEGFYDAKERLLKIVVHGREVTQHEMRDACAARHYNILGPDKPLDNVAFVFMEESVARAHLHELWLRELECRAIIGGQEILLNTGYNPPPPEKPQWVLDVEAREGAA